MNPKGKRHERIFIISFITTILLIIGSIVVIGYTGFKHVGYLVVLTIVSVAITNDTQKAYKKFHKVKVTNEKQD